MLAGKDRPARGTDANQDQGGRAEQYQEEACLSSFIYATTQLTFTERAHVDEVRSIESKKATSSGVPAQEKPDAALALTHIGERSRGLKGRSKCWERTYSRKSVEANLSAICNTPLNTGCVLAARTTVEIRRVHATPTLFNT